MANKTLFQSIAGLFTPDAKATNEAGGRAYALSPKAALAQFAATGCLNATFYASAQDQLGEILGFCAHPEVEPEFIARVALYARTQANMKDMPALLCAVLSVFGPGLMAEIFDRVIDDGRMLRNFVQIMRSGKVGRKSLGTLPKRMVQAWFDRRSDEQVFRASVGNDPSLADVIRMVHPKPATASRAALYGYLIGQPHNVADLPELVKQYEAFKTGDSKILPDVPFQMLTSLALSNDDWKAIASNASWQMTRMNLNTFERHGVFEDAKMVRLIADRLRDKEAISKARVFPYQLMMAFSQAAKVPAEIREALQDAMEIATRNVCDLAGENGVYVFPDISGSMRSPITGVRKGATTAVRCVDVAALIAATVLRTSRNAQVVPFESKVVDVSLNPRDSVMTNAKVLSSLPAGGTNCSAPLAELNRRNAKGDLLIYVSDNESWVDSPNYGRFGGGRTETMNQWAAFKQRNPGAKLVCIDLQPYATTQAVERQDILNIGGFSDQVFDVIAAFAKSTLSTDHWIGVIENVSL
ncbi:MAG: RNA-binding protein [Tepidisphaeraceae bacterium]|jgi:60 kDa SS-A/Ro ribonucleoprotein